MPLPVNAKGGEQHAAFAPPTARAQAPRTLRVATDTNLPWLDPHVGPQFALREIASHVFEDLVTVGADQSLPVRRFPIERIKNAFEFVLSKDRSTVGIIFDWHAAPSGRPR